MSGNCIPFVYTWLTNGGDRPHFILIDRTPESMEGLQLVAGVQEVSIHFGCHTQEANGTSTNLDHVMTVRSTKRTFKCQGNSYISNYCLVVFILTCNQLSQEKLSYS